MAFRLTAPCRISERDAIVRGELDSCSDLQHTSEPRKMIPLKLRLVVSVGKVSAGNPVYNIITDTSAGHGRNCPLLRRRRHGRWSEETMRRIVIGYRSRVKDARAEHDIFPIWSRRFVNGDPGAHRDRQGEGGGGGLRKSSTDGMHGREAEEGRRK